MLIGANLILNDTTLPMDVVARMVEAHDLDALFLGEHTHTPVDTHNPGYPNGLPDFYKRFLDPFVQLTVAATATSRVRLGTGVVLLAERNPLEVAKSVASLDVVSGGRVEFGVGYGWNPLEAANNGIDPNRRRAIFREKLAAVLRLWHDEIAQYDGEFVSFTKSWSYPKPLQRPHPPVLIGAAASASTFDDVANLADGWYPLATNRLAEQMEALAERCGGVAKPVTIVDMAGQRDGTAWYFEDDDARAALVDRALHHADLGVHRLSVGVPADDEARLGAALEVLGTLVDRVR